MASDQTEAPGTCSHASCGRPAVQKCRYCGQGFCRGHLKAKPSSAQIFLHDELPEKLKERIKEESGQAGGHACRPYFESMLGKSGGKEQGEAQTSARASRGASAHRKRHAAHEELRGGGHRKVIALAIVVIAAVALFFYFRLDATILQYPWNCNDGTLDRICSVSKPYYCFNGTLIEKATLCGCPAGYVERGEKCGLPQSCSDSTLPGECSSNKPFFCTNGTLVNRASLCGCPEYSRPNWSDAFPRWNITSPTSIGNPKWYTNHLTFIISENCSSPQRSKMLDAFSYLLNNTKTSLSFTEVQDGCPDITVKCWSENIVPMFEEGVGEAVVTHKDEGYYSVITNAEIKLSMGDQLCPRPNVQLHELLHAFGFSHTKDLTDLMHERFGCLKDMKASLKNDLAQIYPV